ncbi:unnamed protein product (macronuclear) [Paramecium tetraurelia]|uniref:VWFA domain-containing protein n=1 Tax=Paramecium tetraurelia TaxID=5888 RepID=A0C765_PARTE|nr:uncharacterized protein GSPATT00035762001 [Paramecium tetraurelia]CAK66632.1 unnamed protein product [Paramecium tetraurelia]|eukprot:XP_001434029.1 hypothetical protein (macronuclear) [Paramecium tetraurelia strain d4-2]
MSFYIYRAPEAQKVQSFPITLLDGTGSMHKEYPRAINAYKTVFNELGKKKLEYQWAKDLYPLEPFKQAGSGNITNTLTNMFQMLLSEKAKIPKNITLVFISDGKEEFDLDKLLVLIERMRHKYLIQFISVAVGDQFPNSISNTLRSMIHNHDPTCPPLFQITRSNTKSFQQIQQEFEHIFWEIRKRLLVSGEMILINLPVFYTITSKKPQNSVIANSLFLVEKGKTVVMENRQIQPTHNAQDIYQMIINSVQQAFISQAQVKFQDAQHEFGQIQLISQDLLKQIDKSQQHDLTEEQKSEEIKVHATLNVAKQIAQGQLDLTNAKESDLTSLQDYLVNNVHKFTELASKLKSTTAKIVKGIKSIKGFAQVVSNAQHINELKKSHAQDHSEDGAKHEDSNQLSEQDQESEQDKMSSTQEIQSAQEIKSAQIIGSNSDVLNQNDSSKNDFEASPQIIEQIEEPQDVDDLKNQQIEVPQNQEDEDEQIQEVQEEQVPKNNAHEEQPNQEQQNDKQDEAQPKHISLGQMTNILADITKEAQENTDQVEKNQQEEQLQGNQINQDDDQVDQLCTTNQQEEQQIVENLEQENQIEQDNSNKQEEIQEIQEVENVPVQFESQLEQIQEASQADNTDLPQAQIEQKPELQNSDEPEIIQQNENKEEDLNNQPEQLNQIHSYPVIDDEEVIQKMPIDNEELVLFKQPKLDEFHSQSQNIILDEPVEIEKIESTVQIENLREEIEDNKQVQNLKEQEQQKQLVEQDPVPQQEKEQSIEDLSQIEQKVNQNNENFVEENKPFLVEKVEQPQKQDKENQKQQEINEEIVKQKEVDSVEAANDNEQDKFPQGEGGMEDADLELRGQNFENQENVPEVQQQPEELTQQSKTGKKSYLWLMLLAVVVGYTVRRFRKK